MARSWLSLSAIACLLGVAGCSATGGEGLSAHSLSLPETVTVTPQSFAPGAAASAGDAAAEATTNYVVSEPEQPRDSVASTEALATPAAEADRDENVANAFAAPAKPASPGLEAAGKTDRLAQPTGRAKLDRLIEKYAQMYDVPAELVHKVAKRESNYRPEAYSKGNWGLMQIRHATARGMGYDGPAKGLLDAETNLKYAVKYLRGAYVVAGGDHKRADRLYQTGYYYHAKRAGLLEETGLGKDRKRRRKN